MNLNSPSDKGLVFVFGGCGFIGRPTVKALLDSGRDVVVIDNMAIQPAEPLDIRATFFRGDVRNRTQMMVDLPLTRMLANRPVEAIYWFPSKQGYSKQIGTFGSVNVAGPFLLFDALQGIAAHGVGRIILASSQAVYSPGENVTEDAPKNAPSVYGLSKWLQEQSFVALAKQIPFDRPHGLGDTGIPLIALRYSVVLGPGQSLQSSESGILRNWHRAWRNNRPGEVYAGGKQVRDFVHVDDVVKANMAALDLPEDRIPDRSVSLNIGGFKSSIEDLAKIFQRIAKGSKFRAVGDRRPGGEFTLTSCSEKAKRVLGWQAEITLERQVKDFCNYWLTKEGTSVKNTV